MKLILSFFLALFTFSQISLASPALVAEFSESFSSGYREGRCGQNIADLLKRAQGKGIDIRGANVAVITNNGYLLTTTHARNSGEKLANPQTEFRFAPGINNFYFHVALEKEGQIYDFDFGNSPQVVSTKEYIRRMFWEEPAKTEYTGMESLEWRQKYTVAFVPAAEYLETLSAGNAVKRTLLEFYNSL
jgi:hypothetical protein